MNCSICAELSGQPATRLQAALGRNQVRNAVLFSTPEYSVIPSVGPLVVGHSLVVPHMHRCSVVAGASRAEWEEIEGLLAHSYRALVRSSDCVGRVVVLCFEHGSISDTADHSLCSTQHGHLHLLPMSEFDAKRILKAFGGEPIRVSPEAVQQRASVWQDYILAFLWDPKAGISNTGIHGSTGKASQYLRRLCGEQLGVDDWNWKIAPRTEVLERTIELGFQTNRPPLIHAVAQSTSAAAT